MRHAATRSLIASLVVALLPASALADGAIAYGTDGLVSDNGVAVGLSYNYGTSQEANSAAMTECHNYQDSNPGTRTNCHIAASFRNQCIAVAIDQDVTTEGFGWGVGDSTAAANQKALDTCRSADGPATGCAVAATHCDGTAY